MADEKYWTYKGATPTPSLAEAVAAGAMSFDTTDEDWHKLSPGMRREIVRGHKAHEARRAAADAAIDDFNYVGSRRQY